MDGGTLKAAAIAKRLASPNTAVRLRAVRALSSHFRSPSTVTDQADFLKLWKGLFYCVWHSDKLSAQSDLIDRITDLVLSLPQSIARGFLAAGLKTLRREWAGIDFLRLDKFYLLLRRLMNCSLSVLPNRLGLLDFLLKNSVLASDTFQSQGVCYHYCEIYLDELKKFLPLPVETLDFVLSPFLEVLAKSQNKIMVSKVKNCVFEKLLGCGLKFLGSGGGGEGEEMEIGKVAVVMGMSKRFFELASSEETVQGNRKVLFGLHQGFLKLEKELEKSGIKVSMPELKKEHLASSASLEQNGVDNERRAEVGGSDKKPSKKRRKVKEMAVAGNGKSMNSGSDENGDDETGGGLPDSLKNKKAKKKKKKCPKSVSDGDKKEEAREHSLDSETPSAELTSESKNVANAGNINGAADENVDGEGEHAGDALSFDETVLSNLQRKFEIVAAEAGLASGLATKSDLEATPINSTIPKKKRKRTKSVDRHGKIASLDVSISSVDGKTGEKSAKKVRFSIKSNLVWKPHSPLPPQSLRLPPSATPRGSALKKGVSPGPIKEMSPTVKKAKTRTKAKANSARKALRSSKSVTPAVKRLRKLQSLSV